MKTETPAPLKILIIYDCHELGASLGHMAGGRLLRWMEWLNAKSILTYALKGELRFKQIEANAVGGFLREMGHQVTIVDIDELKLDAERDSLSWRFTQIDPNNFDGAWFRFSERLDFSRVVPRRKAERHRAIAHFLEAKMPTVTLFDNLVRLDSKIGNHAFLAEHHFPIPRTLIVYRHEADTRQLDQKVDEFFESIQDASCGGKPYILKKDYGYGGSVIIDSKHGGFACDFFGTFSHANAYVVKAQLHRWLRLQMTGAGCVLQEYIASGERGERRIEVAVSPSGTTMIGGYAVDRHMGCSIESFTMLAKDVAEKMNLASITVREDVKLPGMEREDDKRTVASFEAICKMAVWDAKNFGQLGIVADDDKELALRVGTACGPGIWGIDIVGVVPHVLEINPFSAVTESIADIFEFYDKAHFYRQLAAVITDTLLQKAPRVPASSQGAVVEGAFRGVRKEFI